MMKTHLNETAHTQKKLKSKAIRSIQFLPDRVIVDLGEHRLFQFCKACKNGKHLKNFLNDSYPEINLKVMDEATAIRLERRFYFELARGMTRYTFAAATEVLSQKAALRCRILQR